MADAAARLTWRTKIRLAIQAWRLGNAIASATTNGMPFDLVISAYRMFKRDALKGVVVVDDEWLEEVVNAFLEQRWDEEDSKPRRHWLPRKPRRRFTFARLRYEAFYPSLFACFLATWVISHLFQINANRLSAVMILLWVVWLTVRRWRYRDE